MEDNYRHKGLRRQLIQLLTKKGIKDEKVLNAINKIPRHLFFDSVFLEQAYQDKAFPIKSGQTISQPYTVAFQTQLLEIKQGERILEVGTGSGYQAAVLAELKAKVFTIERQRELFAQAQTTIQQIGYHNIRFFYGDGYIGKPTYGPYDKILITCGAPEIPEALIKQLKIGGKLVAPIGSGSTQEMQRLIKIDDNKYDVEKHGTFSFVPMLKGLQ